MPIRIKSLVFLLFFCAINRFNSSFGQDSRLPLGKNFCNSISQSFSDNKNLLLKNSMIMGALVFLICIGIKFWHFNKQKKPDSPNPNSSNPKPSVRNQRKKPSAFAPGNKKGVKETVTTNKSNITVEEISKLLNADDKSPALATVKKTVEESVTMQSENPTESFMVGQNRFKIDDWIYLSEKFHGPNGSAYGNCMAQIHEIRAKEGTINIRSYNTLSSDSLRHMLFLRGLFRPETCRKPDDNEIRTHVENVMNKAIPFITKAVDKHSESDVKIEFDNLDKLFNDPSCNDAHGSLLSQNCQDAFNTLKTLIVNKK